MKTWVIVLLSLLVVVLAAYTFAQNVFRVSLNPDFSTVEYTSSVSRAPALHTMRFEMSDGATCYALSNKDFAIAIESLDQIIPLGCAK
jgi:lipopolysaccharide export system protein LptC